MSEDAICIEVHNSAQALLVAEDAKDLARRLGFSEQDQAKLSIAVSELARNIVLHAHGRGRIEIKRISEAGKVGVTVIATDTGPGIPDVEKVLQGGVSTSQGLGEGVGAAKRLMDEFTIQTELGKGTTVTAKKWTH